MAAYNLAMQSPYCRQGEFLREIFRSLEIPFANRLLKSDQEVQQEAAQNQQAQTMAQIADHLLKFESKAAIEQIKKPEFRPVNSVSADDTSRKHGEAIQQEVEQFLANTSDQLFGTQPGNEPIHPTGRRKQSQFEGQIPGGTQQDSERSFAQKMGSNSLGTSGT
jgi:hypothetical protein